MRAVILVPRRAGIPERDRAWAWCRRRWETLLPEFTIYEGHDDGPAPFNRSAALNRAARDAGEWDLAVVVDADILIDPVQVERACGRALETGRVTWAFTRWVGLNAEGAAALLDGPVHVGTDPSPEHIDRATPISWSCCFVVPRAVWDELGGFDERFRGWGWEDMAFQSAVCGLYGHERLDGHVIHVWHPRSEERIRAGSPPAVAYVANRMLGRRYMYALRRLGLHDRPTPSDEAEMERDRANIRQLAWNEETDRRTGRPKAGLPDWSDWWPTLEELRDGAKAGRPAGPVPTVRIVMRTGGTIETWPDRRDYLTRSLASLDERVRYDAGETVRVIYSDWPAAVRGELEEIAAAHGFYVVAGDRNVGFTAAMQGLWRYLSTRPHRFDYVFLAEDDFVYDVDVRLDDLIAALDADPGLVQVALLRAPYYAREFEAGTILGHPADEFTAGSAGDVRWLAHRRFFTCNPSLIRRDLTRVPWPSQDRRTGRGSEDVFGRSLFAKDPRARSALLGSGESMIRHIGAVRAGAGY